MEISEEFSNLVVLPDQIPPVEEQEFSDLENKYKRLKHLSTIILVVLQSLAFSLFVYFSSEEIPLCVLIGAPTVIAVFLIWRSILVSLGFPKKGYLLREKDVSYRSGLLFYKLTCVPFNRIQHVEVSQNMIEKGFGLSKVKIYTAGGSVSDLSIPGLLPEKAHQIESFLLSKVSTHE